MPSGIRVKGEMVLPPFCLGASGFYTCASRIRTGVRGVWEGEKFGGTRALSLTDVILHSHLRHFPSSSPFNVAPNLGYSRSCAHT